MIISPLETEDKIENDATEIARCTSQPGNNSVPRRVDMWDYSEVRTVARFSEYCCDSRSSYQGMDANIVDRSNANQDDSLDSSAYEVRSNCIEDYTKYHPKLLSFNSDHRIQGNQQYIHRVGELTTFNNPYIAAQSPA